MDVHKAEIKAASDEMDAALLAVEDAERALRGARSNFNSALGKYAKLTGKQEGYELAKKVTD